MKLPLALALLALPGLAADAPAPLPAAVSPSLPPDSAELRQLLQRGLFEEEASRDLGKAAAAYSALLAQYDTQRTLAATALFRLAEIRIKQGNEAEAITLYQRLLTEFPGHDILAPLSRERLAKLKPGAATPASPETTTPAKNPLTASADVATAEEAAALVQLREIARNSPDLLEAWVPTNIDSLPPLANAAAKGWMRAAAFLLDQGASVETPGGGSSPLIVAARAGHKRMVELLLDRGARLEPGSKYAAETALGTACSNGRTEVIKVLLARGANPNFADSIGRTPLLRTLKGQGPRLLIVQRLLEKGAKPNLSGRPVETVQGTLAPDPIPPLSLAIDSDDTDIVQLLLKNGADPNFDFAVPTQLPLVHALRSEKISTLLLEAGARVDIAPVLDFSQPMPGNVSPLLNLAIRQNPKVALLLLAKGAPKNQADTEGNTALHVAMLQYEYPQPPQLPNMVPQPQSQRLQKPHPTVLAPEKVALLKTLCEQLLTGPNAVEINAARNGYTALHLALGRNDLPDDFIRWLIAKGADPLFKKGQMQTPLDMADLSKVLPLEAEFLFPKIQRKDAIAVLPLLPENRTSEPQYFASRTPAEDHPVPPTLGRVLADSIAPASLQPAMPTIPRPGVGAQRGNVRAMTQQLSLPFDALIFRPNDKGVFTQAAKVEIDINTPATPETWPALQWGDIVVFHRAEAASSKTYAEFINVWLVHSGAIKAPEKPATSETAPPPGAVPQPVPNAQPQSLTPTPNNPRRRVILPQ
jgi:ankyrin repeat protein